MAELRIVAGEWRGRRIAVPAKGVRPTADRVREAWMSIVLPWLAGARVVDLMAGTGALGLEALSRGAAHCDFVEKDAAVRRVLKDNIAVLGAEGRSTIHAMSAIKAIGEAPAAGRPDPGSHTGGWDVAFADPPYNIGNAHELAQRWLRAPFAAIFGVEHEASTTLPPYPGGAAPDRRTYGITALTFYHSQDLPEEQP